MYNVRSSKRNNFGQPPQRLGFENEQRPLVNRRSVSLQNQEVAAQVRRQNAMVRNRSEEQMNIRVPSVINFSSSTTIQNNSRISSSKTGSSISFKQRTEAEIEAAKQMMALEEEEDELMVQEIARQAQVKAAEAVAEANFNKQKNAINRKLRLVNRELGTKTISLGSQMYENETIKDSMVNSWIEQQKAYQNKRENHTNEHQLKSNQTHEKRNQDVHQRNEKSNTEKFMARQGFNRDLPIFSGEPSEWPSFIIQFDESTKMCEYSDQENMQRLQKCLKGKARDSVHALLNLPNQLNQVMNILTRRFGRPDYIIDQMVFKIQCMPPIKEDNLSNLIDFANSIRNLVVTMISLNCENHLMNPQLLKQMILKLPMNMRLQWGEKAINLSPNEISTETFANWLEEKADAASYVTYPSFQNDSTKIQDNNRKQKRNNVFIAQEENMENADQHKIQCLFCKEYNHLINDCAKFISEAIDNKWDWAKKNKVCFICLKLRHRNMVNCKDSNRCKSNDCSKKHNVLLHKNKVHVATIPANAVSNSVPEVENNFQTEGIDKTTLLRIIPVNLRNESQVISTYALLDEGSTVTLVDEKIANQLNVTGETKPLTLQWMNNTKRCDCDSQQVNMIISGSNTINREYTMKNVRTIKNLQLPTQSIDLNKLINEWPFLKQIPLKELKNVKPTILIGQDNWALTVARDIIHGPLNGPVVTKTLLGWVIHGNVPINENKVESVLNICQYKSEDQDDLHLLVQNSFNMDNFGTVPSSNILMSKEDELAMQILNNTSKRIDNSNKWETGLLWKKEYSSLPDSKATALKRLFCLEKKLDKDENYANKYNINLESFISKGYARKLTNEESKQINPKTWYLPHFGASNKPPKLRIVFDAAAKSNGVCLNDALLKGPDLYNSLVGILWNFRKGKIGFTADIQEMFPQIKLKKEDQSSQRFLWRGMNRIKEPETYEIITVMFGAVCSPASAQFVKNKNAEDFMEECPMAYQAITERHYMDDYLDSEYNEESAIKLINDVIEIHRKGGFNICKWTSNSKAVLSAIPENLRSPSIQNINLDSDLPTEKVLGLFWNPNSDCFEFKTNLEKIDKDIINRNRIPTKREVLKIAMSLFDPIGFIAHYTVHTRILMQDIWRSKISWDEKLPPNLVHAWNNWLQKLESIKNLSIPRCYSPRLPIADSIEIHAFCDASEKAYATVVYLRITYEEEVNVSFVSSKVKVVIGSVKKSLNMVLHEKYPREEVLRTLFAETENIINSRPLTFVSLDHEDDESITPNHFLIGSSGANNPPPLSSDNTTLRRQWKISQQLANDLWKRWIKEYLPTLTRRTKWFKPATPLAVGDIVIIVDDCAPRNTWPKGRITQTFPAKDGQVRIVEVKTKDGIFKRPAAKICKLDIKNVE